MCMSIYIYLCRDIFIIYITVRLRQPVPLQRWQPWISAVALSPQVSQVPVDPSPPAVRHLGRGALAWTGPGAENFGGLEKARVEHARGGFLEGTTIAGWFFK